MEEINYLELIEAFKHPEIKDIEFWKKVARIERSIPKYNNKFNWWERAINFCNTCITKHTVEGKSVSIAGLWNIKLELNKLNSYDTFHSGQSKGYTDFYFEPTEEKTDLKIVTTLNKGLDKCCNNTSFAHNADSLLFYCLDTNKYYMVMKLLPEVELDYEYIVFQNRLVEHILVYEVDLPKPELLTYNKPVTSKEEQEVLADLPYYMYIDRKEND